MKMGSPTEEFVARPQAVKQNAPLEAPEGVANLPTSPPKARSGAGLPFVSVCTPTFNRRPFIQTMFTMFTNQTYPKDRLEWIIVDDGTDKISDLVLSSGIPQIRYFDVGEKLPLGAKRNLMHTYCRPESEFIVYMDDDDYYPPERVAHAVGMLMKHPEALCAGASELYIVFKGLKEPGSITLYQAGPYSKQHATAGTFAFRRTLLREQRFEDSASLAEEKVFLRNYTVPFVQLDPLKTILVFSHEHNTFDKRKMLENPHPQYFKESPRSVAEFIRGCGAGGNEESVHRFFVRDIDALLRAYEPGRPMHKPDVLVQMRNIEAERQRTMRETHTKQQQELMETRVVVDRGDGSPPQSLSLHECARLLQTQHNIILELTQKCKRLETQLDAQARSKNAVVESLPAINV